MASYTRASLPAIVLTACALCLFAGLHWEEMQPLRKAAPRFLSSSPMELAKEAAQYLNRSPADLAQGAAQGITDFLSTSPDQIASKAKQLLKTSPAVQQLAAMLLSDEQARESVGSGEDHADDADSDAIDLMLAQADVRAQQLRLGMAEKNLKSAAERAEGWLHDLQADSKPRRQRQRATRKAAEALTTLGNFQAAHGRPVAAVMGLQRAVKLTKKALQEDAKDAAEKPVFVVHDGALDIAVKSTEEARSDLLASARAKVALAKALCAAGGRHGHAATDARALFGEAIQALNTAETITKDGTKGFMAGASQPDGAAALLADAHADLAKCLHLNGDLATAGAMLRAASLLAKRASTEAHANFMPRLARLLGGVRHDEGTTEEARRLYKEFLETAPKPHGTAGGPNEFVELFETLQDHALTDASLGQPQEALSSLDDVRVLQERFNKDLRSRSGKSASFWKDHGSPDLAVWASMARTWLLRAEMLLMRGPEKKKDRSYLKQALEAASHGVSMLRQLCTDGDGTKELANARNTQGNVLVELGHTVEAEEAYSEALELSRELYGDESPLTAANLHNVGSVLQRRGNSTGALQLFRKSLAVLRRTLGDSNPDVAAAHASIASVLSKTGKIEEARKEMAEAARVAERGLPPDHIDRKRYEALAEKMNRKALAAQQRKAIVDPQKEEKDQSGEDKAERHTLEESSMLIEA